MIRTDRTSGRHFCCSQTPPMSRDLIVAQPILGVDGRPLFDARHMASLAFAPLVYATPVEDCDSDVVCHEEDVAPLGFESSLCSERFTHFVGAQALSPLIRESLSDDPVLDNQRSLLIEEQKVLHILEAEIAQEMRLSEEICRQLENSSEEILHRRKEEVLDKKIRELTTLEAKIDPHNFFKSLAQGSLQISGDPLHLSRLLRKMNSCRLLQLQDLRSKLPPSPLSHLKKQLEESQKKISSLRNQAAESSRTIRELSEGIDCLEGPLSIALELLIERVLQVSDHMYLRS
ncbi:MAG: hypothetical protein L7U87_00400 [Chlamydiales bacterium]|nr:hypothetical protein [Chlamydiales bacterium]